MRLLLCPCGTQLAGKQRLFCSDRCRKRASRNADRLSSKPDKNTIQNIENLDTVDLTTRFFDILSVLDVREFEAFQRQMAIALTAAVEYEEVWQQRCLANPGKFEVDRAQTHQTCGELLQNILDFVQELRSE